MTEVLLPLAFFCPAALIEWAAARLGGRRVHGPDSLLNVGVYAGYLVIISSLGILLFELYSAVHVHALLDLGPYWMDPTSPRFFLMWGALFVLDDLTFYWFHRSSHRFRFLWASHVTHHSSEHFNLTVGLRQTWTPFVAYPFWLLLPLIGFDPLMVMATQGLSLTYQAFIHTEVYDLPHPLGLVFNTPAHHRVHHGANAEYVDKNFGGVLIIWDRLFGTFQPKTVPVRYGIGRAIRTANPAVVGLHGWIDLVTETEESS